jgi:hypothetical protein
MAVGGGGGGGASGSKKGGGGGGAGGVLLGTLNVFPGAKLTVAVGAAGTGGAPDCNPGGNGGPSTITTSVSATSNMLSGIVCSTPNCDSLLTSGRFQDIVSLIAYGGGGGGGAEDGGTSCANDGTIGSGGGAGSPDTNPPYFCQSVVASTLYTVSEINVNQGKAGAPQSMPYPPPLECTSSASVNGTCFNACCGGGGASTSGTCGTYNSSGVCTFGGTGGYGVSIVIGTTTMSVAGGGGAGAINAGTGNLFGGGAGSSGNIAAAGVANTGGGGGSPHGQGKAGAPGGTGVVYLWYQSSSVTSVTASAPAVTSGTLVYHKFTTATTGTITFSRIVVPCPIGTFSNYGYYEKDLPCFFCAAGTYSAYQGTIKSCISCPVNTYQSQVGQYSCTLCGSGKYNPYTGRSSETACITTVAPSSSVPSSSRPSSSRPSSSIPSKFTLFPSSSTPSSLSPTSSGPSSSSPSSTVPSSKPSSTFPTSTSPSITPSSSPSSSIPSSFPFSSHPAARLTRVSFQCTGSSQSFFFDRTFYHSNVSVYVEGAAGGGSSNCPGKLSINFLFIVFISKKLFSSCFRWKGGFY